MSVEDRLYAEEISNMAQGHKANLSNPNTSEESKKNSERVLKQLGGEDAFYSKDDSTPTTSSTTTSTTTETDKNVLAGHKATLSNPNASESAKQHSKQILQQAGAYDAEDDKNVLAGHKAALSNPNVSEEAKQHSAQVLRNAGVAV